MDIDDFRYTASLRGFRTIYSVKIFWAFSGGHFFRNCDFSKLAIFQKCDFSKIALNDAKAPKTNLNCS
jgi:hypothetical protein